jgi:hypothetical protein
MAKRKADIARLNAATRTLFLAHLAESSNISGSARYAGISSNAVYAERRRSPAFRGPWHEALAEGYARPETELLAEALQAANGKIGDGTLKAQLILKLAQMREWAGIPLAGSNDDALPREKDAA